MENTQACNLIKQLSQDMLETALRPNGRLQYPRCDSSDCLVCQGQRSFCNQAVTNHVCSWLEQRMSAANSNITDSVSASVPSDDRTTPEQRHSKRLKREDSQDTADCLVETPPSQPDRSSMQHDELSFNLLQQHGAPWAWRPEWADTEQPAPCRMVELAQLQSPAELCGRGQHIRRGDMICGLEFSLDGQLLATAGVSKQVALYALATVAEQQQQQQQQLEEVQQLTDNGHKQQKQQQQLPSLPPVALVRLPGKVSSIAWSPDMEGVMTIGDYDGTLTQVHVASGHYFNEIDAHSGRRIWSVAHSCLRPHLAATASDDCTAKLWAGRAFADPVATVILPNKPAVCDVDFSQSDANIMALAAADARVYLYDLRQLCQPLAVLQGHRRPVSYAKFFGPSMLVSASIDGTLAAWELGSLLGLTASSSDATTAAVSNGASSRSSSSSTNTCNTWHSSTSDGSCHPQQQQHEQRQHPVSATKPAAVTQPWKVFRGHVNEKNFVGLSVQPAAGLMAVGSESGEVFTYHTSWSDPLARRRLQSEQQQQQQLKQQMQQPAAVAWSQQQKQQQQRSACAVAWRPYSSGGSPLGCGNSCSAAAMLAAATSAGECKLLGLVHP